EGEMGGTSGMRSYISVHGATTKYFSNSFVFKNEIEKEGLPRDTSPALGAGGPRFKSGRPDQSFQKLTGISQKPYPTQGEIRGTLLRRPHPLLHLLHLLCAILLQLFYCFDLVVLGDFHVTHRHSDLRVSENSLRTMGARIVMPFSPLLTKRPSSFHV